MYMWVSYFSVMNYSYYCLDLESCLICVLNGSLFTFHSVALLMERVHLKQLTTDIYGVNAKQSPSQKIGYESEVLCYVVDDMVGGYFFQV